MARMRTVREIVSFFKDQDPDTRVSEHFVRTAIANGFPVVKTGSRNLVNLDLFIEYLNGSYDPNKKDFSITEK